MPALHDRHDLAVSTRDAAAVDAFERALAALQGGRGSVDPHVDAALRREPSCVIAHCLRATGRLLNGDLAHDPHVGAALAALDRWLGHANERERAHAAALRAWHRGEARAALDLYDALLVAHPRDGLALRAAHALDFRLGQREMMRDRVARVLPHWHPSLPGYGYVLGMYAFGLEETGDYARAEALARRALEAAPDNAAAMHVIAHVLEMQGRAREGVAWLEATRAVWRESAYAIHNAWHLALFHLDRDAPAAALAIHDEVLRPPAASATSALIDGSALLWRLVLRGVDVENRFRALASAWRGKVLRGARAFTLAHAVMALAAAGDAAGARSVAALLREDRATRKANLSEDLALAVPFCEALCAFAGGDYARAVDRLSAVRARAEHCGGSIAQCDLIHLTFVESALRGRHTPLAQALAAERRARRPASRLNRWLFARAGAMLQVA
ncbi:MAG: tetratricopeptide repeat protein [Rudaea sp.]